MRATQQEYEKIKEAFEILSGEMDDRDEDCAIPKNAVDKGYSLAVEHMKREMEEILTNISSNIKIQPNNTDMISKTEVIQMLRQMQIDSAKCCGFFVGHVTQLWVIKDLLGDKIHELGGKAYTVDKEGNVLVEYEGDDPPPHGAHPPGGGGHAGVRRGAPDRPHPGRHRRGPALLPGPALPQPLHRRRQLPRHPRVRLRGRHGEDGPRPDGAEPLRRPFSRESF